VREPLTDAVDLVAFARGFRANAWPSGRTEGGPVKWSESYIEAGAGIEVALGGPAALEVGYRLLFIDEAGTSHEDGNYLSLLVNGLDVGIGLRF
jgi:hypothetical protein